MALLARGICSAIFLDGVVRGGDMVEIVAVVEVVADDIRIGDASADANNGCDEKKEDD